MKIGDHVKLRYHFRIIRYDDENDCFTIFVETGGDPFYWMIPRILSNLGFRCEINNFVYPGDGLPAGHPDFYKRLYIDTASRTAVYADGKDKVNLVLDENFDYTGKYYVISTTRSSRKERYASLKSNEMIISEIATLVDTPLPGEVLSGVVVSIFVRYDEKPSNDSSHYSGIEYFDDTDDASLYHPDDIIILIHEIGSSDTEFELPLSLTSLLW